MELSGRDVRALVSSLQSAVNGKIQKVYGTDRFALVLDLYARDLGYRYLYVELPSSVFLSNRKAKMPDRPSGFAARVRAQLQGLRIESIEQPGMDRVIVFRLAGRKRFSLVIELFAKGNIVVLDEGGVIRNLISRESFGSRDVRPGVVYSFPPASDFDPVSIPEDKHLVAAIASAGFGGACAERILVSCGVDPASATIRDVDLVSLKRAIALERDADRFRLDGRLVADPEGKGILELLDSIVEFDVEQVVESVSRSEKVIDIQSRRLDELTQKREDDLRRGEVIFENYAVFDEMIAFAREFRAQHSSLEGLVDVWPERFPSLISVSGVEIVVEIVK